MIHVKAFRAKNGNHEVWLARWYVDGRRGSRTLGKVADMDEQQAEKDRDKLEFELRSGEQPTMKPDKMTLGQFRDWRMEVASTKRSGTKRDYRNGLKDLSDLLGLNIQVRDIGRVHMRRLQRRMRDSGKAKSTIAKTLNSLRTSWKVGIEDGLVTTNPFSKHGEQSEERAQRIYSSDEVAAMIQSCPNDWWAMFLRLLATSGLRRTECLRLQWRHIDFEAGTVTVARQDPDTFRAKGKTYPLLAWRAKAKASYRTIPLPTETVTELRRYKLKIGPSEYIFVPLSRLALADELLKAGKLEDDYPLATNRTRSFGPIQQRARVLLAESRKVPVDQVRWTPGSLHDFRDTFLTANKHLPIDVLKRIAGHSTLETTLKYYVSERPEDAAAVRAAVDAAGLANHRIAAG